MQQAPFPSGFEQAEPQSAVVRLKQSILSGPPRLRFLRVGGVGPRAGHVCHFTLRFVDIEVRENQGAIWSRP